MDSTQNIEAIASSADQHGLIHFWSQGDFVSHFVMILLLAMSILSWTQIALKALRRYKQRKIFLVLDKFWEAKTIDEAAQNMALEVDAKNSFLNLAKQAAYCAKHLENKSADNLSSNLSRDEFVTKTLRQSISRSTVELESGLTALASIGAVAPFVGLFGTVYGIYHALLGISLTGSASLNTVSGPVGEALIMTAIGLFVAIPAVLAYNSFVRLNRLELMELDGFAHNLHSYLTTGHRSSSKAEK